MPKERDVQKDRFRVIAEVDEALVGRVLSTLSRLGVEHVGYELVTDIRTHHLNPRQKSASLLGEFLSNLGARTSFSSREVIGHFTAAGATPSAAYFALKKMLGTNQLVKFEDNTYGLVPKQLPAPTKAPAAALSNVEKAIQFLRGRERFHRSELTKALDESGVNTADMGSIMSRLQELKRIKPTGTRGQYTVINNHAH